MNGGGAPERGVRVAGQPAERRRARGREGQHRARGPDFLGQGAQVLRGRLDVVLARHDHEQRTAGEQQGDEQARGAGEAVDLRYLAGLERATERVQARVGGEGGEPGRGRGDGAHRSRIRSTMAVVDRPGTISTRTTRPPAASTSARPTMASSAQSAPFTRMSGSSAAMISRGVSSS